MLSLVADYNTTSSSSSSSSEEEDNNEREQQKDKQPPPLPNKPPLLLPSANLLLNSGLTKTNCGEVFSNPFLEAEQLEIDKLQKHVKMVDAETHLLQKNGRKICWSNRKGRCRFGNKCKYAHDSDLVEATNDETGGRQQHVNKELKSPTEMNISISKPPSYKEPNQATTLEMSGETMDKSKNRKRPGLGDSIIPGKRVMKTYHHTKKSS